MSNIQNLKRFGKEIPKPTSEQAREWGKKGGEANGKAIKKAKTSKEIVKMLDMLGVKGKNADIMRSLGIPEEYLDRHTLRLLQLHKKAEEGDVRANRLLLEVLGELNSFFGDGDGDGRAMAVNIVVKDTSGASTDGTDINDDLIAAADGDIDG